MNHYLRSHSRLLGIVSLALVLGTILGCGPKASPAPAWSEIEAATRAQQWPRVESLLTRWLGVHPGHGQASVMLAALLSARNDDRAAGDVLQKVAPADPWASRARFGLGEIALKSSNAAEAEREYLAAANLDPKAMEPRQKLIYLYGLQQRSDEARQQLWGIHEATNDPRVLIDLVLELTKPDLDVRGVGQEIQVFLAKTPEDPFLRRSWGLALLGQGRFDEAYPHLQAASASLVNDPWGRFGLAECSIALGQAAARSVDALMGDPPEEPRQQSLWWTLRARIEDSLGRSDVALGSLRNAIQADPKNIEAHYRLGRSAKRAGHEEESKTALAEADRLRARVDAVKRAFEPLRRQGFEAGIELFQSLAEVCEAAGWQAEAAAWWRHLLDLDPRNTRAKSGLASEANAGKTLRVAVPIALSRPIVKTRDQSPGMPQTAQQAAATNDRRPERLAQFDDVAERLGLAFSYNNGASDKLHLADTMGGGVALLDYDNDGRLDVYFINGCALPFDPARPPAPNRLFRNTAQGRFEDVTERAGVGGRGYGMGAAVGDYDNDGDDDLFVSGFHSTVLYRNNGDGSFTDVTTSAGVGLDSWSTAAGFGDLDHDGDLDLMVVTYVKIPIDLADDCRDHTGRPIHCSPSRYPDEQDVLFRNNGDGTFTNVTRAAGIEAPRGRGLGLAIADFDADGRLDLYVANDASPDFFFHNVTEPGSELKFEEEGLTRGLALNGAGQATASMGVAAEDLDGDGTIDLFITNFLNESNTLHRNLGGWFQDATLAANLSSAGLGRTGFGTCALDLDRDGVLDLVVANGHVDHQPWINSPMAQTSQLFWGVGGGRYQLGRVALDATATQPTPFTDPTIARGIASGDLDNDGKLELLIIRRDTSVAVLRNTMDAGNRHWLGLRLRGTASGSTPVGAKVVCKVGSRIQTRWLTSGTSYLSVHDQRLWFGLGTESVVNELSVVWPSRRQQTWRDLKADAILEIVEGSEQYRRTFDKASDSRPES